MDDTNKGINNMGENITNELVKISESEQKILDEILKKPVETKPVEMKPAEKPKEDNGKDLFEDIDVFSENLKKLYTIKKIGYIEGKTEDQCTIL